MFESNLKAAYSICLLVYRGTLPLCRFELVRTTSEPPEIKASGFRLQAKAADHLQTDLHQNYHAKSAYHEPFYRAPTLVEHITVLFNGMATPSEATPPTLSKMMARPRKR